MAGDWVKVEDALPDKPEVIAMSSLLDIDQDAVVGKLLRIWIWAGQQSIDGNALSVTSSFLDRLTLCNGFADAMRKVGWLEGRDMSLSFPRFDRHNGQSAKKRALTNRRVASCRSEKRKSNADVTHETLQKALPEKRREEKKVKDKSFMSSRGLEDAKLLLSYLNTKARKNFRAINSHLDLIRARLKEPEVTPQGVREMIDSKCSAWIHDPEKAQYLRPQTLFAKNNFASYYDQRGEVFSASANSKGSSYGKAGEY